MIKELIDKLIEKNISISTAESCTGGKIASFLVEIPNVSKVFNEGIICYSNNSKIKYLNVDPKTLEKYGAVSREVVLEMLKGLTSDVGIATSGILGPNVIENKEVGTVYIGIKVFESLNVLKYKFKGNRKQIQRIASIKSIKLLKETFCG